VFRNIEQLIVGGCRSALWRAKTRIPAIVYCFCPLSATDGVMPQRSRCAMLPMHRWHMLSAESVPFCCERWRLPDYHGHRRHSRVTPKSKIFQSFTVDYSAFANAAF
jgi:hypothetical protein